MYTLILVDYNSLKKTVNYIRHYTNQVKESKPVHIVLVDNGTQENLAYIESEFGIAEAIPNMVGGRTAYRFSNEDLCLIYCKYGENAGYARGNNLGMQLADAIFGDAYYIISNNDLILPDAFSFETVTTRFLQEPSVGVIGPKVIEVNGKAQTPRKKQSAFTKLIAWYWGVGPLRKYVDDILYDPEGKPCQWVSGCFFFARAEAMRKIQGFDENTFLYAEEMILSARLQRIGYTTLYDPMFTIIHDHKEAYKSVDAKLKTIQMSFDSICYYYKTYCGTSALMLLLAKFSFGLYKLLYPLWQLTKEEGTN